MFQILYFPLQDLTMFTCKNVLVFTYMYNILVNLTIDRNTVHAIWFAGILFQLYFWVVVQEYTSILIPSEAQLYAERRILECIVKSQPDTC